MSRSLEGSKEHGGTPDGRSAKMSPVWLMRLPKVGTHFLRSIGHDRAALEQAEFISF